MSPFLNVLMSNSFFFPPLQKKSGVVKSQEKKERWKEKKVAKRQKKEDEEVEEEAEEEEEENVQPAVDPLENGFLHHAQREQERMNERLLKRTYSKKNKMVSVSASLPLLSPLCDLSQSAASVASLVSAIITTSLQRSIHLTGGAQRSCVSRCTLVRCDFYFCTSSAEVVIASVLFVSVPLNETSLLGTGNHHSLEISVLSDRLSQGVLAHWLTFYCLKTECNCVCWAADVTVTGLCLRSCCHGAADCHIHHVNGFVISGKKKPTFCLEVVFQRCGHTTVAPETNSWNAALRLLVPCHPGLVFLHDCTSGAVFVYADGGPSISH